MNKQKAIEQKEKLAELIGIILPSTQIDEKHHKLKIFIQRAYYREYMKYVKNLINSLFFLKNIEEYYNDDANYGMLTIQSELLIKFLNKLGIRELKRARESVSVPIFIKGSRSLKIKCLKGLVDNGGWIKVNNTHKSIYIGFSNSSKALVCDFQDICKSTRIRTGNIGNYKAFTMNKNKN